jgi:hypothetical protein
VDALLRGADSPSDGDPRSCNFKVPQQSCIPGPEGVDWSCRSDCASECGKCGTDCRTTMGACRSGCATAGAACPRGCGQSAGACLDACLRTRDRCATHCSEVVAEYVKEVNGNYGCKDKRPALDICKRAVACVKACPEKNGDACRAACKKSRAAGCNAHFLENVEFGDCFPYESPI